MRRLALLLALLAGPLHAQATPEEAARTAAARLQEAAALLAEPGDGPARIATLTEAVRAHETGLAALRDGLRRVALRERALTADLEARQAEVARLLGVLSTMRASPAPLLLLHPTGPLGTARAGMALREVTPALQARAEALRGDLEALATLRAVQQDAAATVEEGLASLERARGDLSRAVAERADPGPMDAAVAALLAQADTLDAFADGLSRLPPAPEVARLAPPWPLPVAGRLLRAFGEADAAGIARDGWIVATPPGALVVTPAAGTVRYAGPLLDQGLVILLEPEPGVLLVFSGLSTLYADPGAILDPGAPLGTMGGGPPSGADFAGPARGDGGAGATESLYIEVRQGGAPVDPGEWFAI